MIVKYLEMPHPLRGFQADAGCFRHFRNSCLTEVFPAFDRVCLSHSQLLAKLTVSPHKGLFPFSCEALSKVFWLWRKWQIFRTLMLVCWGFFLSLIRNLFSLISLCYCIPWGKLKWIPAYFSLLQSVKSTDKNTKNSSKLFCLQFAAWAGARQWKASSHLYLH